MRINTTLPICLLGLVSITVPGLGQNATKRAEKPAGSMDHDSMKHDDMSGMDMPGMDMPGMDMSNMDMSQGMNSASMLLMEEASGTSMNPRSWQMPMVMKRAAGWDLMAMGQAFVVDTQQSGPRGADKFYSTNWLMLMAEHSAGTGAFSFNTMLSLEPATVTNRRYPLLFQTGETAYGRPIVDAQHPHDFFMGLSVEYAHPIAENVVFQAYFAPVGDPALGPVAYPHRASAAELPEATLGHHWEDSTHISDDVATVALNFGKLARIEASGFHGGEPDEFRWNIDQGPMDSWATRLSISPGRNWMAQVSVGRLSHPEAQEPGDVVRTTASLMYNRPIGKENWSTSFIWGRNHKTLDRSDTDAFLVETVAPLGRKNFITGRAEWVDKDELFADQPVIQEQFGNRAFRIGAYTAGYTRDIAQMGSVETGIGANISAYSVPDAIRPYYGDHPFGVNVYLRFRLRPQK